NTVDEAQEQRAPVRIIVIAQQVAGDYQIGVVSTDRCKVVSGNGLGHFCASLLMVCIATAHRAQGARNCLALAGTSPVTAGYSGANPRQVSGTLSIVAKRSFGIGPNVAASPQL